MTKQQQHDARHAILKQCHYVTETKGEDYSDYSDVLCNFKLVADTSGLTKYQVWLVYCSKHFIAIENAIKRNPTFPSASFKSESVESRIIDCINYMLLLNDLMQEDHASDPIPAPFLGIPSDEMP